MSWLGDKNNRLDFSSCQNPDPVNHQNTKRKLINLAEVCSRLSALVVSYEIVKVKIEKREALLNKRVKYEVSDIKLIKT